MELGRSFEDPDIAAPTAGIAVPSAPKRSKTLPRKLQESLDAETSSKLPQMVQSDALLIFVASIIEGDPDTWGVLLTKKHGKTRVAERFIAHLSQHTEPLTNGKTSTAETVAKWIKIGKERAEAETVRRATASVSGRTEAVPELDKAWFKLMQSWTEYLKDKPGTSRYTTPPAHLVGVVALEYDKSALMRIGREEKAAGDAMREEAIERVAEARDSGRAEKGPENKEHLKPTPLVRPRGQAAAAAAAPVNSSDAFLQAYVTMETRRFEMEEQRAKMDIRKEKMDEIKSFAQMLASAHIDAATRASVAVLFAAATKQLHDMDQAAAAIQADGGAGSGAGADGGMGGYFNTPVKTSSGVGSSASSSVGTPGSAGK